MSMFYDYGHTWWENGYTNPDRTLYMRTARFGAALKTNAGTLLHFGALPLQDKASETFCADDAQQICELPALQVKPELRINGRLHRLKAIEPLEELHGSFGEKPSAPGVYNRILESGRILQRCDMMQYVFADTDIVGRMELAMYPDHCCLSFELFAYQDAEVELALVLSRPLGRIKDGALFCKQKRKHQHNNQGKEQHQYLRALGASKCGTRLMAKRRFTLKSGEFDGISLPLLPSTGGKHFPSMEAVTVSAVTLQPLKGQTQPVFFAKDGCFEISQDNMFSHSGETYNKDNLTELDSLCLTLHNHSDQTLRVPLRFVKNRPLSITGLCPLLRDENGEPLGIPVQLSKNWHHFSLQENEVQGDAPTLSPKRHYEGKWFHGYAVVEVPARTERKLIYTCTFATWGTLFAASHAQLCLAGWGGGQQWETSAIGSFGESFCYDIARTWTWCCMGDICPAFIDSRIPGHKYDWTGNIGGGDFLFYITPAGTRMGFAGMKTHFAKQGPCMTEVHYSGYTADRAVQVDITVFMGRTDDLSHALHRFEYTFLKDVEYTRMSFYQMGSDSYNYDYWDKAVVENQTGVLKTYTLHGQGDNKVTLALDDEFGDTVDYGFTGPGLFAGLYKGEKGQSYGDKLLLIHEYEAVINGKKTTEATLSTRTTNVMNRWKGFLPELVPPQRSGIIKANSKVSACVDYICLPLSKQDYYASNTQLLSIPNEAFDTPDIFRFYKAAGRITPTVHTGSLLRTYPLLVKAVNDGAELHFTGGIGYTPVTICGLSSHGGYQAEVFIAQWQPLAQEVHGNDYWQCYRHPDGTFEHTYNLPPNSHFRLTKKSKV